MAGFSDLMEVGQSAVGASVFGLVETAGSFAQGVANIPANFKSSFLARTAGTPSSGSTDPNLRNPNYTVTFMQTRGNNEGVISVTGSAPETLQMSQIVEWSTPFAAGLLGDGLASDIAAVTLGTRLVGHSMTMQVWQGKGSQIDFVVPFELRVWSDPWRDVMQPIIQLLEMASPTVSSNGFLISPGPIITPEDAGRIMAQMGNQVGTKGLDAARATLQVAKTTDGTLWQKIGAAGSAAASNAKEMMIGATTPTREANTISGKAASSKGVFGTDQWKAKMKNVISVQIGSWFYLDNCVITDVQPTFSGVTPDGATGALTAATIQVTFRPTFMLTAEDMAFLLPPGTSNQQGQTGTQFLQSLIGKIGS